MKKRLHLLAKVSIVSFVALSIIAFVLYSVLEYGFRSLRGDAKEPKKVQQFDAT